MREQDEPEPQFAAEERSGEVDREEVKDRLVRDEDPKPLDGILAFE